jgi:hypothetical protein
VLLHTKMLIFESSKIDRDTDRLKFVVSSSSAGRRTQNLTTIFDGNYSTNLSIRPDYMIRLIEEKHSLSKKTVEYYTGTYKSIKY